MDILHEPALVDLQASNIIIPHLHGMQPSASWYAKTPDSRRAHNGSESRSRSRALSQHPASRSLPTHTSRNCPSCNDCHVEVFGLDVEV